MQAQTGLHIDTIIDYIFIFVKHLLNILLLFKRFSV